MRWMALTLGLALFGSGSARADDRHSLSAYFLSGFGGEGEIDPGSLEADLDPSVGLGARFEAGVLPFLALGGFFELRWFEFDAGTEKTLTADIAAWIKGRYFLTLTSAAELELYLGMPIGFSIAAEPDGFTNVGAGPGWNIGVMAGAQLVLLNMPLGLFIELGWRRHHFFYETDGGAEVDIKLNQMALLFGVSYRF